MKVTKENFNNLLPSLQLAASKLKGSERRMFLGQLALDLGRGGRVAVSKRMGISRVTLNKGIQEVLNGSPQKDLFDQRGRKPLEEIAPGLLEEMKKILDGASQTDPQFKSTRLYTRLSPNEVRNQLVKRGYKEDELPSKQTIWNKMHSMGYKRKKVAKTKPKKK